MSSVFARDRKYTPFDPIDFCADLQDELSKYLGSEKYVPKKWRFLLAQGTLEKCDELMDNILDANAKKKGSEKRKERIGDAITNCIQLDRKLARLKNVVPTASGGSMTRVIELLTETEMAVRRMF